MVTETDVGFEPSTTFVTEVSPALIDGFDADDSLNAPNEKETDGAVSDLVSELVEATSVAPEMTKKKCLGSLFLSQFTQRELNRWSQFSE